MRQDAHRLPIVPTFPSPCVQHLPAPGLRQNPRASQDEGSTGSTSTMGLKRSDVPSAPQLHTSLCTGPGQHWSPVLSPRCTEVFVLATGRRRCLAADMESCILSPLCVRFSEQEGKSKWRGKTSIDGTARRKKRAFHLTERSDLSVVSSRNLKQMCFAGICCR